MKTLTLTATFVALLCFVSKAQQINIPIDSATNSVSYSEVIKVDSASKTTLYLRAKEWFAKTYSSSNYVIQMDDKEAGKIIGKGKQSLSYTYLLAGQGFKAEYTISVTAKDGRYRYEITNISVPDDNSNGYHLTLNEIVVDGKTSYEKTKKDNGEYRARFKGYVIQTDKFITTLISSLKLAMASTKPTTDKDNF